MTIVQLAKKINVSMQQIFKYQTGANIQVGRLVQIAEALMIDPEYFFQGIYD
jgi:transcriptional regulator with XRE-family HTH domain